MRRKAAFSWACGAFLALLLAGGGSVQALTRPSSDLLLPYFEVELDGDGTGDGTTFLGIANALDKPVDVLFTVQTNWGIPVLDVPLKLKAREVRTFDLRSWIESGDLPVKDLTARELLHLQAALTGRPSPRDGLYYSADLGSGLATGAIAVRTRGSRPDALRGEYFLSDPSQGSVRGDDLADVDRPGGTARVCSRHVLRPLPGAKPEDGAQVILWTETAGQVLPAPVPADRRRTVRAVIFSAAGKVLERRQLRLLPVEKLSLAALGLAKPLGRIELTTEDGSLVSVHASEDGRGPDPFGASCAQPAVQGPKITITTLVNDQEASSPPGPKIPIGSPVQWKYRVANAGAGTLTRVSVFDDQGSSVRCPKSSLQQGESMTCTAKGVAESCQRKAVATARAVGGKKTVTAQSLGHYFGDNGAGVEIVVSTNGRDANDAPGPRLQAGTQVDWTYRVENTGTVRLFDVEVTDDHGVEVSCSRTSLAPGEPMTCTASGTAVAGQYTNVGTVTARASCGTVSDSDPSNYFGESDSGIQLRVLTNGYDADFPPGPTIPVDSPVTWEYVVTNSGKLSLNDIRVSDDHGVAVSCPDTALLPGKSMICLSRGVAVACQYRNQATVQGRTSLGPVSASDASHYFGQSVAVVQIETFTNGDDADLPPGPAVPVGTPVQWTYVVTNTGRVPLTGVTVKDDRGVTVTCPASALPPGQSMTCTAGGTAISGDYRNVGRVTAQPPCGAAVSDEDPSHYRGSGDGGVRIRKLVNEQDANVPPGPSIPVGDEVSWSFVVTNSGSLALRDILVTDSRDVAVTCPQTELQPGQSMTCFGSGVAEACQYDNLGTVTARTSAGRQVSAVDPAFYFGKHRASVKIEMATNGDEADSPPGPLIKAGTLVGWTYTVANTGDVTLTGVEVRDDRGAAVTCPKSTLEAGEAMACFASGTAIVGQYRNVGSVTASPPCGPQVTDQDPSHYFGGGQGAIGIRKLTNGQDANGPPGPTVPLGGAVSWTYVVTNTGEAALSNVEVTDNRGVAVTCPRNTLEPGESMSCTGTGTAQACQYDNLGTATGETALGQKVSAVDPSYYHGQIQPAVTLELSVNGQEADVPPGPTITVGTPVTWIYTIANSGNAALANVQARDDQGAAVICPKTALEPGEAMRCFAFGTAVEGPFRNLGTVTADPPCGTTVTALDSSNYVGGGAPGLTLRKLTNNQDVGRSPGPSIPVGDPVIWLYEVANVGQVSVSQIVVSDDRGVVVSCPQTSLVPAGSMTCTGRGTAQACQYDNLATATGRTLDARLVSAVDASFYYGELEAEVRIETSVNGNPADAPPGPSIPFGDPVRWTYMVTNPNPVALTNVKVSDDQGALVFCPKRVLQPGESMTCTADGTAGDGPFRNVGTVTADPPCGSPVSAQDPSHYFGGGQAAIGIRKLTNGQDANTPPGPTIPLGGAVSWTYIVTNTGGAVLSNVSVTDNRGVAVTCPRDTLAPGEWMTCTGAGTAQACQYDNLGTATGETALGQRVSATDPSHYRGQIQPAVTLELSVNGQEADVPPGPTITVGTPVIWTYAITNSGNAALSNVRARDDQGTAVTCPKTALEPGEAMRCFAFGTAVEGPFRNLGTVTADPPCGSTVTAIDASNYVGGGTPGLTLRKLTNNQDVGRPPGPSIPVGESVFWLYEVTNVGQVSVSQIVVSDDRGVVVSCPKTSLVPAESMTCTGRGTAQACQYDNLATATGRTLDARLVSAVDASFYYGQFEAAVQLETSVNGSPADTPPGLAVPFGDPVQWTYLVTNPNRVALTNVKVSDDQGALVFCPQRVLQPGESMTCTAEGTAVEGPFRNVGTVTADPPCGSPLSAQDAAHYFGVAEAELGLRKLTNGRHFDDEPGPRLEIGSQVTWSYIVTNQGNVELLDVRVTDDQGVAVTCPQTSLDPGESMTCTGTGITEACQYRNRGSVTGHSALGEEASGGDESFYYGEPDPDLELQTFVNGQDADSSPGPTVEAGTTLTWMHIVTNTGDVELTNVQVTDSGGVGVICPKNTLEPGVSMTCTGNSTAEEGSQSHTTRVTGEPPCGSNESDSDTTHYKGEEPEEPPVEEP